MSSSAVSLSEFVGVGLGKGLSGSDHFSPSSCVLGLALQAVYSIRVKSFGLCYVTPPIIFLELR
jgi:hypothetical protein